MQGGPGEEHSTLQIRSKMGDRQIRRSREFLSWALMLSGALLIAAAAAYFVFAKTTEAQLKDMEQSGATASPDISEPDTFLPPVPADINLPPNTAPNAEWISIPSIEVDSKIVELGTKVENGELVWETPNKAVGHHKGTANPGEVGNVVMSGHISSPVKGEGSVFKRLPEIGLNDEIIITTPLGHYYYKVTGKKVVVPEEISVMDPTSEPVLTLITCVPDWVYTHRLIVTAKPVKVEPR